MRTVQVTLAGRTLDLAVTFKAAEAIARDVHDPMHIAREAALEAMIPDYVPKWQPGVATVPLILHAGVTGLTVDEVKALCADAGYAEARDAAMRFVMAIVTPTSQVKVEAAKGNPGE